MIPKIIHQTWKNNVVPKKWRNYAQKVQDLNPDWEYRLWTDDGNEQFVEEHFPDFLETFLGFSKNIMRADVIQYLLMYKYGGVYLDLDYEFLKPFNFGEHEVVLPLEMSLACGDDRDQVGNCVFASVPNHPYWKDVINSLKENPPLVSEYTEVVGATGPIFLNKIYKENTYSGIHTPEKMIYHAPSPNRKKSAEKIRKNGVSIGIHHPWGSWKERFTFAYVKQKIKKQKNKLSKLFS